MGVLARRVIAWLITELGVVVLTWSVQKVVDWLDRGGGATWTGPVEREKYFWEEPDEELCDWEDPCR